MAINRMRTVNLISEPENGMGDAVRSEKQVKQTQITTSLRACGKKKPNFQVISRGKKV